MIDNTSTTVADADIVLMTMIQMRQTTVDTFDTYSATSKTLTNKTIALDSNTVSTQQPQFNLHCQMEHLLHLIDTETLTNKTSTTTIIDFTISRTTISDTDSMNITSNSSLTRCLNAIILDANRVALYSS